MISMDYFLLVFLCVGVGYIYVEAKKWWEMHRFHKRLLHYSKDIIYYYQIYPDIRFKYVSPSVRDILGRSENDFLQNYNLVFDTVHPEDYEGLYNKTIGNVDFSKPQFTRWLHSNGEYIHTEDHAVPIYDKKGKLIAIEGAVRDITYRRKLEAELEYRSTHDKMTGLFNREYYDEVFDKLNINYEKNIGIIVCDVDRLKYINDNLGHREGDNILRATANILIKYLSESRIVSRIGGDEFTIITKGMLVSDIDKLIKSIYSDVNRLNSESTNINISLSIGYSFREVSYSNMIQLFKEADDNMYINKRQGNRI